MKFYHYTDGVEYETHLRSVEEIVKRYDTLRNRVFDSGRELLERNPNPLSTGEWIEMSTLEWVLNLQKVIPTTAKTL